MRAPEHWEERLKTTWPDLTFRWHGDKVNRWEVWCEPDNGEAYRVLTIQNRDGSFRPIDNRVFARIAKNDLSRVPRGEHFLDILDRPIVAERRERLRRQTEYNYEYAERLRHGFLRDGA